MGFMGGSGIHRLKWSEKSRNLGTISLVFHANSETLFYYFVRRRRGSKLLDSCTNALLKSEVLKF